MSINTLLSNPPILAELAALFGGGGGGELTNIVSSDGNLTLFKDGTTMDISFAQQIDVSSGVFGTLRSGTIDASAVDVSTGVFGTLRSGTIDFSTGVFGTFQAGTIDVSHCSAVSISGETIQATTEMILLGEVAAGAGSYGTTGQVLTSQGTGTHPIWATPGPGSEGLKFIEVLSGTVTATSGSTGVLYSGNISGLTQGKRLIITLNTSFSSNANADSRMRWNCTVGGETTTQLFALYGNPNFSVIISPTFTLTSAPAGGATQLLEIDWLVGDGYVASFPSDLTYQIVILEVQ